MHSHPIFHRDTEGIFLGVRQDSHLRRAPLADWLAILIRFIVHSNIRRIGWKHQKPEVQRNLEYSQVKKKRNRYAAFVAAKERLLSHEKQSVSNPAPITVEDLTAVLPKLRICEWRRALVST